LQGDGGGIGEVPQVDQREVEAGRLADPSQQRQCAGREVGAGQVVRHLRRVPHRGMAGPAQPVLEQRAEGRRDHELGRPLLAGVGHGSRGRRGAGAGPTQQRGIGGVGEQTDRAGVGHGHRHPLHPDHPFDVEELHEVDQRLGQSAPLQIRLGAVEEEERPVLLVVHQRERELGDVDLREGGAVEGRLRARAPVVEQLVGLEGDQAQVPQLVAQVRRGDAADVARIHHPRQRVHQREPGARDGLQDLCRLEPVQITRVSHRGSSLAADWTWSTGWRANPGPSTIMDHRAPPIRGPPGQGAARGRTGWRGRAVDDADEQIAREIAREQGYADRLYRRLDELVAQVERNLDQIQGSQHASTHQNRSERDSFMALYEDRLALLRAVSRSVVFGRLDMADAARHYIGRIGLFTPDREQLLVDWRAPAAAAFYRATSTDRQSVRLRRHLINRGRAVVGLEDDVLDQSIIDDPDHDVVLQGEGALLAAVSGRRTGRMGDIVATIQGEQDRIIRSENRGVLVVQGGPGTGKTAVALHRAAYLLYTHRRRLEHTGVLIMAPTPGFLRYIERVLPSLGESGVVMLTPGELFPGIATFRHDEDDVARLKGDAAMAELLSRAVKQRQIVPRDDISLRIDGTPIRLTRDAIRAARREARASHKPHNTARAVFGRAAMDRLVEAYEESLRARGRTIVPEDRPDLLSDLRHDPEVRRQLNLAWLPYTPQGFLRILLSRPDRLREAAPRAIADRVELLV